MGKIALGMMYPVTIDAHRGALTSLYCATSPEIEEKEIKCQYFFPIAKNSPEDLTALAKDDSLAEKLWTFTENLIQPVLQ